MRTKICTNIESTKRSYRFKSACKNPAYSEDDLIPISRSCYIHHKLNRFVYYDFIQRTPKNLTVLEVTKTNGNPDEGEVYEYYTNEFKASKWRRTQVIKEFFEFYAPVLRSEQMSIMSHTFTRTDYCSKDISTMLKCVKRRYGALKRQIRGYFWILEVSENDHIHYHLCVAIDRLDLLGRKIPKQLKFEDLWGQRTQVKFVYSRGFANYLFKDLNKSDTKITQRRSYGRSQRFILEKFCGLRKYIYLCLLNN